MLDNKWLSVGSSIAATAATHKLESLPISNDIVSRGSSMQNGRRDVGKQTGVRIYPGPDRYTSAFWVFQKLVRIMGPVNCSLFRDRDLRFRGIVTVQPANLSLAEQTAWPHSK